MNKYHGVTQIGNGFVVQLNLRKSSYVGRRQTDVEAARLYDAALYHLWPFRKNPLAPRFYNFGPYGTLVGRVPEISSEIRDRLNAFSSDPSGRAASISELRRALLDAHARLVQAHSDLKSAAGSLLSILPGGLEVTPEEIDRLLRRSLSELVSMEPSLTGGELATSAEQFRYTLDGTPVDSI